MLKVPHTFNFFKFVDFPFLNFIIQYSLGCNLIILVFDYYLRIEIEVKERKGSCIPELNI